MNTDDPTSSNIHISSICLMAEHYPVHGKKTSLHKKDTAAWLQALISLVILFDCLIQRAVRQRPLDVRSSERPRCVTVMRHDVYA